MFEHFGMMDIWSGFKKHKYIFMIIISIFTLLFIMEFLKTTKNANIVVEDNDNIYLSTAVYYAEPTFDKVDKVDAALYKSVLDDYITVLNSDFCKKYIFENLINKYSSDYIIENSGLGRADSNIRAEDIGISSMGELYQAKKSSNTMVVEISSMTYSPDLSDSVVNILKDFIVSKVDEQISNLSLKLAGEANRTIKTSDIALENIDKTDKRNIVKSPTKQKSAVILFIKKVIIPLVLILVLCIAVIVINGLFNPTLNRASDFSEYNVPLIGEIKNFKKE